MWHVEVKIKSSTNNTICGLVKKMFLGMWLSVPLNMCKCQHCSGAISMSLPILVVEIKQYIGVYNISNSWHKDIDIYTELDIPKVATWE